MTRENFEKWLYSQKSLTPDTKTLLRIVYEYGYDTGYDACEAIKSVYNDKTTNDVLSD